MGLLTLFQQLVIDLGNAMSFFAEFWTCLPLLCRVLMSFVFGAILLLGLMQFFVRSA